MIHSGKVGLFFYAAHWKLTNNDNLHLFVISCLYVIIWTNVNIFFLFKLTMRLSSCYKRDYCLKKVVVVSDDGREDIEVRFGV